MKTMKALVKKEAREGLWLDEVPVPEIGINDVLIEILRTGICGTDVHIYNWDAWSQKTIPVPLGRGPRVRRPDRRGGQQRQGLSRRRHRQRRGARRLRTLPKLPGRPPASLQGDEGRRRQSARRVRRVSFAADDERLASRSGRVARRGRDLRSVGQRRAYGPVVSRAGRGRADHRRRPDRHHGRGGGASCRRAARRHHRRESVPPRTGPEDEAHAGARRQPARASPTRRRSSA